MFEHEAGRLRTLAKSPDCDIWLKSHARDEMKKDGIARLDIEEMLCRCRVTLVEQSGGDETWRAEGKDFDGRTIVAVVVVDEPAEQIRVITAWAAKER